MKKILYLGLNPPHDARKGIYIHCPIIQIIPRSPDEKQIKDAYQDIPNYTHIVFTSKSSVRIFFNYLPLFDRSLTDIVDKTIISVGTETTKEIEAYGLKVSITAINETAEGVVEEIKKIPHENIYIFWPHSAISRTVLNQGIEAYQIAYREAILYDTEPQYPKIKPNIAEFDEILFTSPSTVDAFFRIFGAPPKHTILSTIGPVTKQYLEQALKHSVFS